MQRPITDALLATAGLAAWAAGPAAIRFQRGRRRADREWSAVRYSRITDMGTVERLAILPLIDWHTARDDLVGEAGVSYLVRAGDTTILFDIGLNAAGEHPSPMLRNMAALDVDLGEIDALVNSTARAILVHAPRVIAPRRGQPGPHPPTHVLRRLDTGTVAGRERGRERHRAHHRLRPSHPATYHRPVRDAF